MAGYSVEDQVTALEALAEGRKLRQIAWVNLALWIVFFLLAAIDLGIILLALWSAWQTGDWENLDDNMLGAMFPFVLLFLLPIFPAWHRNALPAVDALRHAAIESRDNALFDSALPEEPDTTDLPLGTERFDHIGALSNRQVADRLGRLVPISAILLQPSTFLFSLYNGISRESVLPLGTYLPDSKTVDTSMAVLGAVMLLLWIVLFVRARKYRRGVPVTADEWGIQWHPRRHRTVSLAWHDVRSFFMFSYGSTSGSRSAGLKTQVYVLDAGDTLLVWQRYPALSNVSAAVRQRKEVDRFVKLVVARTGKPLRDLSVRADELASASTADPSGVPQQQGMDYGWVDSRVAGMQLPRRARRRFGRKVALVLALLLLPILLVGGAFAAKAQLHDHQTSYYASLPVRLHAQHPLNITDMRSAGEGWLQQSPLTNDPFGYSIEDDGYHVTGPKGDWVGAWLRTTYVDSAVEVTASQTAGAQYDGVGLILRSDILNTHMVVFFASPTDGSWTLDAYHYDLSNPDDNWTYLASGTSDAIHIGVLQPNRLLAIMRGGQYLLYINNQFVGSYYDDAHETPRRGYAGVYVNDGTTEGIFTNFSVYQVKPPPSLEYV